MAKVSFTKLGLKLNQDIKTVEWNDQTIEVKQYLPVEKKLNLITNVIQESYDFSINYASPVKENVYTKLLIIENYTNISFTDKQRSETGKLYDLLNSSGLLDLIFSNIPEQELNYIFEGVKKSSKSIYKYQTSILGILETIGNDYSSLDLDLTNIVEKIQDPESLNLIKDILTKLG